MPLEAARPRRTIGTFVRMSLKALWERHLARRQLRRTRLDLFHLSDAELRDIGLTREVSRHEAARSLLAYYLSNAR